MKERCFRILDHDDFQQNCSYKIHYEMCPLMPDLYWPISKFKLVSKFILTFYTQG